MKLIYRGIKYNSHNLIALRIVSENRDEINKIIHSNKLNNIAISYKFPFLQYAKQFVDLKSITIYSPHKYWHKHQTIHLENCWKVSDIKILKACWEITLKRQKKVTKTNLPIKLKYRGITYYK